MRPRPALSITTMVVMLAGCASTVQPLYPVVGRTLVTTPPPTDAPHPLANVPPDASLEERDQVLSQAFLRLLASFRASGGAIAIVRDGEIGFARGFGTTDGSEPVSDTTLFRIGSVGKL